MALKYKLFVVIPMFAACIGTIICIISLATPWWYTLTIQGIDGYIGLWKMCVTVEGIDQCVNTTDPPSWLIAVRAMTIISVLLILATLTFCVLSIIKGIAAFVIAVAVSALAQAGSMVIGLAIFIGESHDGNGSLGWSFGIGWAGVGLYLSGMAVAIVLAVKMRHVDYAPIN